MKSGGWQSGIDPSRDQYNQLQEQRQEPPPTVVVHEVSLVIDAGDFANINWGGFQKNYSASLRGIPTPETIFLSKVQGIWYST